MVHSRRLWQIVTATVSVALGAALAETALRVIDGYRLSSIALVARTAAVSGVTPPETRPDRRHLAAIRLGPHVWPELYDEDPDPRPHLPVDEQLARRAERYPADPYTPFFSFNRRYLERQACGGAAAFATLDDYFVFDPIEASPYPVFRHLLHANPPGWFPTNNFGWRGRDIESSKSAETIRIAFVGASTTVDAFGVPFSHPEYVDRWLNVWLARTGRPYRIEIINAGRTGIDSKSIAGVVRQELVPVRPDLVIYYEGANQFWPGQIVSYRLGRFYRKPAGIEPTRLPGSRVSALVRRVDRLVDRATGGDGSEPLKPPSTIRWPDGVAEQAPVATDARLPMDLPQVIRDLESMRESLGSSNGELAISSFVWLVHDKLRLDPGRHREIFRFLNSNYWPLTYADLRRVADFQNRVFERYAHDRHLAFIDLAAEYPMDPDLFDDAIHLNAAGLRLQAWVYLQHLAAIIDRRIADGVWPRGAVGPASHPAFEQPPRQIVTLSDLKTHCS